MLEVLRIDHVTFVVSELEPARRFYAELLGMTPVPRPAFPFDGLWFQAGTTQIHLILEHPASGPADHPAPPITAERSRTRHIAFEVPDARRTTEKLRELGIPIIAGPKLRPDGFLQLYIRDPDGNVVELFSQ